MKQSLDDVTQTALDWAVRIQDPTFDEWDAHLVWIEQDAGHAAAYRLAAIALAVSLEALETETHTAAPDAANDDEAPAVPSVRRRQAWLAGSIAAVAASVAGILIPYRLASTEDVVIRTAVGETRTLSLEDGTTMALNGDTVVRRSHSDPRQAIVDHGEVFVTVAHDDRHPFSVIAGGKVFQDVGTAFNVRVDREGAEVGVAEGTVAYDPDHANIRIDGGRSLVVREGKVILSSVAKSNVGSWRSGRLIYSNADIGRATADLSRSLGISITVSPNVKARRFTGVIVLKGSPDTIVQQFASLAELSTKHGNQRWILSSLNSN